MNSIIKQYNLKPGDRIVVPKSGLRIVYHHVIYLGQNDQGVDLIIENKIGYGVRIITADEFFSDVIEIARIERFKGISYEREIAIQKALSKVGLPYNLITYNCQHFANEVQYGKVESAQVTNAFASLFAVLFISLLSSD
jgi:uncharacterized protein YycO